jgi:hypothetical protein
MSFLEKFDISQIIGLIFIFTAAADKFLVQDILINRMFKPGAADEKEAEIKKRILTLGINAGAIILALVGVIFLFGFIKL